MFHGKIEFRLVAWSILRFWDSLAKLCDTNFFRNGLGDDVGPLLHPAAGVGVPCPEQALNKRPRKMSAREDDCQACRKNAGSVDVFA